MRRWLVVLVMAATWTAAGLVAVRAAGPAPNGTNFCPFTFMNSTAGPDPDFVTLSPGPAVIPAAGTTPVGVTASESEGAPNTVMLQLMAKSSKGGSTSATSTAKHNTTTTVKLAGGPGVTWTVNWFVTFDDGIHPCSSSFPGYHPFTITSG